MNERDGRVVRRETWNEDAQAVEEAWYEDPDTGMFLGRAELRAAVPMELAFDDPARHKEIAATLPLYSAASRRLIGEYLRRHQEPCRECGSFLDESCGIHLGGECVESQRRGRGGGGAL